jgi:hypothetical protein
MKTLRKISAFASALALGLVLVSPSTARAQGTDQIQLLSFSFGVTQSAGHSARVTVLNPAFAAPVGADEAPPAPAIYIRFDGIDGDVRLAPGEAYTYTVDLGSSRPRRDSFAGTNTLVVALRVPVNSTGTPAPKPAITVEIVSSTTGATESVHVIPSSTAGVRVASEDLE